MMTNETGPENVGSQKFARMCSLQYSALSPLEQKPSSFTKYGIRHALWVSW
jgi:hypothetical protein